LGQLIPFTDDGGAVRTHAPLVLLAADRTDSRFEVSSIRCLRELIARGITPCDIQYDCTEATPGEISTAAACDVGRFAIDSTTELAALPRHARVLVHVAATPSPVWRALLAGLRVDGVIVESRDLTRAGDVCTRLALEGVQPRILQVAAPLSAEERRSVAAAYPYHPDLWCVVGRLDAAAASPEERADDAVRRAGRDA
jgi:hypothetical protein